MNIHKMLEDEISQHIPKDSIINNAELADGQGNICVNVHYEVSREYAEENQLCYTKRILSILLQRGADNKGIPITSFADRS